MAEPQEVDTVHRCNYQRMLIAQTKDLRRIKAENERLQDAASLAGEVMRILVRAINGNEDTVYAYREATQLLRDPLFDGDEPS